MVNLSQALGIPTVFSRFNPDRCSPGTGSKPERGQDRERALVSRVRHLLKTEQSPLAEMDRPAWRCTSVVRRAQGGRVGFRMVT